MIPPDEDHLALFFMKGEEWVRQDFPVTGHADIRSILRKAGLSLLKYRLHDDRGRTLRSYLPARGGMIVTYRRT